MDEFADYNDENDDAFDKSASNADDKIPQDFYLVVILYLRSPIVVR